MSRRVLALPPLSLTRARLNQIERGVCTRFGSKQLQGFAIQTPEGHRTHYAALFDNHQNVGRLDEMSLFDADEVVVVMPKLLQPMDLVSPDAQSRGLLVGWPTDNGDQNFVLAVRPDADIYLVDRTGGVRPSGRGISEKDDPGLSSHVFNRLGPRDARHAAAFIHFPYGYLYRDTSWGPLDDFGHRNAVNLASLTDRPDNHKVVTCHGGSAAWGWECLPGQVWSDRLSDHLNDWAATNTPSVHYTVLNLAAPGGVVLNEIITHLLHAHQTRPDIVISLSGGNDLWVGQGSDPALLRDHQITYQYEHSEPWSRLLHGSNNVAGSQPDPENELKVINPLATVLRAYVARMRQFRDLVQTTGSAFVWALQATMHSKTNWSALEREALEYWGFRDKAVRENMVRLYKLLENGLQDRDRVEYVSINTLFNERGANEDLFWDFIHPTPEGHALIAERVFEHLRKRGVLISGLGDGNGPG